MEQQWLPGMAPEGAESTLPVTDKTMIPRSDPHWSRTIKTLEKAASNINQRVVIEAYGARLLLTALGLEIPEPVPERKPFMVWGGEGGRL